MKFSHNLARALALLMAVTLVELSAFAFKAPSRAQLQNFDKREHHADAAAKQKHQADVNRLASMIPDAKVDFHDVVGSPKWIHAASGFLTGPHGSGRGVSAQVAGQIAADDPHRATKAFLQEHRALFGHGPEVLADSFVVREDVAKNNGLHSTVWEQRLYDLSIFQANLISHVTAKGELVNISDSYVANPAAAADRGTGNRQQTLRNLPVTAARAVALAAQNVGEDLSAEQVQSIGSPENAELRQKFTAPGLNGETAARLIWLPLTADTMKLTWEILLTSHKRGEMFKVLIDAQTGQVLLRQCLTEYLSNATYNVYTSDSPSPMSPGLQTPGPTQPPVVSRVLVTTNAFDTTASPNGWINDGVNETIGNNVDAHTDLNADDSPDLPRPSGSPDRVFDFTLDLAQAPGIYANAAVVQLFYYCNVYHDRLYEFGFTEAAGNFQTDNFGRGGSGNDAVQADAQDGSGTDNANFSSPPDGTPGRMQMYVFTGPNPDRDGDLDAEIVFHEHTHGLSNRLVGGGAGLSALQPGGMGEGWSDFYALCLLSESGDDPNAAYAMGGYATYLLGGLTQNYYYGIRRYPYSTDLTKNPLTLKDIDPSLASPHTGVPRSPVIGNTANEVHNMGEVWCVTLWEARANLISKYGTTAGNTLVIQLVTDGMKLSPANPTYLQARDAIIQADQVDNAGANVSGLWNAFAKRGMGFSAVVPSANTTSGVIESFDTPDTLGVSPNDLFVSNGDVGGPFTPAFKIFSLTNSSSSNLTWTTIASSNWFTAAPTGGVIPPGSPSISVTVSINSAASALPAAVYNGTLQFSNVTSGNQLQRSLMLRVGQPDYFTELFGTDNDLDYKSFTFTTNNSISGYSVCRTNISSFPTDPTGGTAVALSDDSYAAVALSGGATVAVYGTRYSTVYIGSNGYLTFGSSDTNWDETLPNHFNRRRVSALFDDLNPATGGQVSWKQLSDRLVVTYANISEYGVTTLNNFQIEMFFDGKIRLSYLDVAATDGLIGLSAGNGAPGGFVESDFSTYPICTGGTPSPVVVNAGTAIVSENCTPPNGAMDPGETVQVNFSLQNIGSLPTTNLVATLLSSGGIFRPSSPQVYGALPAGGAPVARAFTFMPIGSCGDVVTATLALNDGPNNPASVPFVFNLGKNSTATNVFTQPGGISIPTQGSASPYPSSIVVSGVVGSVSKVSVTLANFSHTYPDDLDILLVGPTGQAVMLMSDCGGDLDLVSRTVTFDDSGSPLPDSGQIVSGTYAPGNFGSTADSFPLPAPDSWGSALSVFNGTDPNGGWQLYVFDDAAGDSGSIGSWNITIQTAGTYQCCEGVLSPLIHTVQRVNNSEVLTFNSISNHTYRIQYKGNLNQALWNDVVPDLTAAGSVINFTNALAFNTNRFFRVLALPVP